MKNNIPLPDYALFIKLRHAADGTVSRCEHNNAVVTTMVRYTRLRFSEIASCFPSFQSVMTVAGMFNVGCGDEMYQRKLDLIAEQTHKLERPLLSRDKMRDATSVAEYEHDMSLITQAEARMR